LAAGLAEAGHDRATIERRLGEWRFHPAVAFKAAAEACATTRPTTLDDSV
jgi:hypothetical protein